MSVIDLYCIDGEKLMMILKLISSLEKCFLDDDINSKFEYKSGSCLKDEIFRFGACYYSDSVCRTAVPIKLTVKSEISEHITVKRVEHVPVKLPVYNNVENNDYLRTTPGLFPDALTPLNSHNRLLMGSNLESLFIEVDTKKIEKAGVYAIELSFSNFDDGTFMASSTFDLEIIDCALPEQKTIYTQWFHCDCLMNYYGTKAFDEKHWIIIENYLKTAVKNGINMILTPVFTPPLDTYVGGERPTVQLVDVIVENGKYSFNFDKLKRWVDLCSKSGIKYFEISHLFTQWGALHAPKIIATVDGNEEKIFGWETDAAGTEYAEFLREFIPQLLLFLEKEKIDSKTYFHISDEPTMECIENYTAARSIIAPLIKGRKIIDAISNYELYETNAGLSPIPATEHIKPFIKNGVPDLRTYYACDQHSGYSNRFISMPSYRNRIIGIQMYKYGIKGFLHWGYNFYNSQFSYAQLNPYLSTDGDYFSPAGDAFSVYPAPGGTAYESIRLAVFHDALQDIRALELCEELCGREKVMEMVEEGCTLTFDEYPRTENYILELRKKINMEIKEKIALKN